MLGKKSVDYLKTIHPTAEKIELRDSIYKQLTSDPHQLVDILRNKIIKWRESNVNVQGI